MYHHTLKVCNLQFTFEGFLSERNARMSLHLSLYEHTQLTSEDVHRNNSALISLHA